jgi:RNA polymerase sigma-70 factor (ECF subfamily)
VSSGDDRNPLPDWTLCHLEERVGQASLDELLDRARRREAAALEELVERYSPRVYALLLRLTGSRDVADDFLQETFLRVVRTIEAYEHVGRFEAWLFRIAANLARDYARQRRRVGPVASLTPTETDSAPAVAIDPEVPAAACERMESQERSAQLASALARLPEADREILLLRHYSELSFREIAELLGVPLGTALARAHRALQKLRAQMGVAEIEDGERVAEP